MKRSARYPDEVVVSFAALNLPRACARRADAPQFARPSHLFRVRVWVFFQGCGVASDKMRGGRSPIHPKPTESLTFSPVQSNRVIQQKKKWEKQELNGNGNPVRVKLHVKTNDKVVVIAGADKGKVTEVVEVFTKSGEILCKDVNIKTKHVKPKGEGRRVRSSRGSSPSTPPTSCTGPRRRRCAPGSATRLRVARRCDSSRRPARCSPTEYD